jgi:transcriptional regulator with XRE-family HTH domain
VARSVQPLLRKVGDRVRSVRTKAGFSQEELAHRAGLDRSYMSGIERGVRNVTLLKLQAVARALRVTTRELLPDE